MRRAFALPVVILLTLTAALVVGVALQRHAAQRLLVQRQIVEYRRHHDMLGAQAILRVWLSKQRNEDLAKRVSERVPAHRFSLPNGVKISVYLADGQGLALADLTGVFPDDVRSSFQEIIYRLPEFRPDLIRRAGPPKISVNAAPREVLAALRADDTGLADVILAERVKRPLDPASFRAALERGGISGEELNSITSLVEFESTLWRLTVVAEEPGGSRTFTALAELPLSAVPSLPALHEWREERAKADQLPGAGAGAGDAGPALGTERRPSGRTR